MDHVAMLKKFWLSFWYHLMLRRFCYSRSFCFLNCPFVCFPRCIRSLKIISKPTPLFHTILRFMRGHLPFSAIASTSVAFYAARSFLAFAFAIVCITITSAAGHIIALCLLGPWKNCSIVLVCVDPQTTHNESLTRSIEDPKSKDWGVRESKVLERKYETSDTTKRKARYHTVPLVCNTH